MFIFLLNLSFLWLILFLPFFIGFLILFINNILAPARPNVEKLSAYECGFSPFGNARMNFHVHYYLVAIFFIIFDLEIVFLIPWSYVFLNLNLLGTLYAFLFLCFLGIGFFYEIITESLDWNDM